MASYSTEGIDPPLFRAVRTALFEPGGDNNAIRRSMTRLAALDVAATASANTIYVASTQTGEDETDQTELEENARQNAAIIATLPRVDPSREAQVARWVAAGVRQYEVRIAEPPTSHYSDIVFPDVEDPVYEEINVAHVLDMHDVPASDLN